MSGNYRCPECIRPLGELHKGGCSYDQGHDVSEYDADDRAERERVTIAERVAAWIPADHEDSWL